LRSLRLRVVFAFFAATCGFPGVGSETAWGSAWLLPPGDGQIIAYSDFSDSTRAFDWHGNLIPVRPIKSLNLAPISNMG